ncbi:MAG: hypothetical protein WCA55_19575, partial [Xanthobacteraceae bacterium]
MAGRAAQAGDPQGRSDLASVMIRTHAGAQSAAPKIRNPKRLPMRTTVSAMVFTFAVSAACADATNGEHLA